jgi:hypothetical protein
MSGLLYKRLARSLWRTKLRLFAVLAMVAIGVMAGISFGSYAQNAETLYAHIYADTDDGVNLPDLWVENAGSTWDGPTADAICERIAANWPDAALPLKQCEARLRLPGVLFHTDEDGKSKQVTGICPSTRRSPVAWPRPITRSSSMPMLPMACTSPSTTRSA